MTAYYNEIDPYAAQWLRNLISAGHIAPGDVDERSIEDVRPDDLRGYIQCHFFAGVGVWSHALRRAGWKDSQSVWTGSCPCQPFSAAGKGDGFDDERHLWPAFNHLIAECKPSIVIGEQVASKDADAWVDLVCADMEALGYAFGAVPFPSAGVGAPHIRDRNYWVAHANNTGLEGRRAMRQRAAEQLARTGGMAGGVDDAHLQHKSAAGDASRTSISGRPSPISGLAYTKLQPGCPEHELESRRQSTEGPGHNSELGNDGEKCGPGPNNGFWRDADWLGCRDGKWRPVEPGYEQMADGSAASLGRVCASAIKKIEKEIDDWSIRYNSNPSEALRGMWHDLSTKALSEREAGRFSGVLSPTVLLAFLRQLTDQGWKFAFSLSCSSEKASRAIVRVLRFDASAACPPLRRELDEQQSDEFADPLRVLSSILAHNAEECWGEACWTKANSASFPLAHGASSRTGRLRGYGNAINAEAAKAFIESVMTVIA